ncbi:MAG TPA: phosphotransferase family protein [Acidimicrobiales bacterium]|nr:phosphotransferase family protein [Acidimicrobiales bacterium]
MTTVGIAEGPVTAWFGVHVPQAVAPLTFERVAGGHSCLTFIVTDAAGERFVLRRPPLGHVLATAHDVVREHRVMSALQDTGVPVPRMLGVCTDVDVNDAPFYVMGYVDGVVLHSAADASAKLADDDARVRATDSLVDALVALHAVDIDEVGLGDLARRTGYLERQLKRWAGQWSSSKTRELPGMERLHEWLVANRPDEPGSGIIHGDYRLGNLLHAPDGTVLAILDWELCTLGDPLADVSYLVRSWVGPTAGVPDAVAPASAAPGFPAAVDVAERYAKATGMALSDLDYWMAFNAWRSAAIAEGVYRRYIDGDMGTAPPDVDRYQKSVDVSVESGLRTAGLA